MCLYHNRIVWFCPRLSIRSSSNVYSSSSTNPGTIKIVALLHDYISIIDETLNENYHVHAPREAEQVLSEFEYPPDWIKQVRGCIAAHRASTDIER